MYNDFFCLFADVLIELLIDGLGRASPIDDAEACIYGYGAVRFLANAVVSSSSGSRCINSSNTPRPTTATSSTKKHRTLASRLYHVSSGVMFSVYFSACFNVYCFIFFFVSKHGANDLMILHLMMINETVKYAISLHELCTIYYLTLWKKRK